MAVFSVRRLCGSPGSRAGQLLGFPRRDELQHKKPAAAGGRQVFKASSSTRCVERRLSLGRQQRRFIGPHRTTPSPKEELAAAQKKKEKCRAPQIRIITDHFGESPSTELPVTARDIHCSVHMYSVHAGYQQPALSTWILGALQEINHHVTTCTTACS